MGSGDEQHAARVSSCSDKHNRISYQPFYCGGVGYLASMPDRALPIALTAVGAAVILVAGTTTDTAPSGHPFGVTETLTQADGTAATYTVTNLGPSIDPVPVSGRLFEATVTVQAVTGNVTPVVPLFNARAAGGLTYPVLAEATTAAGLSRGPLKPGERATGRIYFDVSADTPNSVVCNNGMGILMEWVGTSATTPQPPPAAPRSPGIPTMQPVDNEPVPA